MRVFNNKEPNNIEQLSRIDLPYCEFFDLPISCPPRRHITIVDSMEDYYDCYGSVELSRLDIERDHSNNLIIGITPHIYGCIKRNDCTLSLQPKGDDSRPNSKH